MSSLDYSICISCGGLGVQTDLGSGEERPCCLCQKARYDEWIAERQPATRRIAVLDDKGRCCGRKPLAYKRPTHHFYCTRCNAQFDAQTGRQQANWAWVQDGYAFVATHPTSDYARRAMEAASETEAA